MRQRVKYGTSTKEWVRRHKRERLIAQATTVGVLAFPCMVALIYLMQRT